VSDPQFEGQNAYLGALAADQPANGELIDQLQSEYIYTEMFKAFDVDGTGAIDREDLDTAAKAMGWKSQQRK